MAVTIVSTHVTSPWRIEGWVNLSGLASYQPRRHGEGLGG